MAYWVKGRDAQTGGYADPLFSEAADEGAARAEAVSQGLLVESVEFAEPHRPQVAGQRGYDPFLPRSSYQRACWHAGALMILAGVVAILFFSWRDWDAFLRSLEAKAALFRDGTGISLLIIIIGLFLRIVGRPIWRPGGLQSTPLKRPTEQVSAS